MLLQWFYFLIPLAIEKKLKAAQELSENFEVRFDSFSSNL